MIRVICDVCGTSRAFPAAGSDRHDVAAYIEDGRDNCRSCAEIDEAARRYASGVADAARVAAYREYIAKARVSGRVRQPNTPEPEPVAEPPAEPAA